MENQDGATAWLYVLSGALVGKETQALTHHRAFFRSENRSGNKTLLISIQRLASAPDSERLKANPPGRTRNAIYF